MQRACSWLQVKNFKLVHCRSSDRMRERGKLQAWRLQRLLPEGRRQRKECEGRKVSSWLCGWDRRGKRPEGQQWICRLHSLFSCSVFWPEAVLPLCVVVIRSVMTLYGASVKNNAWDSLFGRPAFRESFEPVGSPFPCSWPPLLFTKWLATALSPANVMVCWVLDDET